MQTWGAFQGWQGLLPSSKLNGVIERVDEFLWTLGRSLLWAYGTISSVGRLLFQIADQSVAMGHRPTPPWELLKPSDSYYANREEVVRKRLKAWNGGLPFRRMVSRSACRSQPPLLSLRQI